MIRRIKNATIAARLIASFALIIAVFLSEIAFSRVMSAEIAHLNNHNIYMMAQREMISEFHREFTEKRRLIRESFMNPEWRDTTAFTTWRGFERQLTGSYEYLASLAVEYKASIIEDEFFPAADGDRRLHLITEVMTHVYNIYDTFSRNFFQGRHMNFDDEGVLDYAADAEQKLRELRELIAENQTVLMAYIDDAQNLNTLVSIIAISVAFVLAAVLAIMMVRSFTGIIRVIKENATLVTQGKFDIGRRVGSDEISLIFTNLVAVFVELISEISFITYENQTGNTAARLNAENFEGGYKDVALSINALLDSIADSQTREMESSERMRLMFESTPVIIEFWNKNYEAIDCNPHTLRVFGIATIEEYIAKYEGFFPPSQPCGTESWAYWNKHLKQVFEEGRVHFEMIMLDKEDRPIYIEVLGVRMTIGGEDVAVTYSNDVTVFRQMLEERERVQIAEQNSLAKSKFLASMSHEIRTPISAVLGIAEIQMRNTELPMEIEEAFAKIHNSAGILLNIINDILDISKIEAGKMELITGRYEFSSLIMDTIQLHLVYLGSRRIKFSVEADENMPACMEGDELRIKQVMNNILSNAFKYTDVGKVALDVRCIYPEGTPEDETILRITVSDTGKGMTPQQIEALKDEYIRFHEQASRYTQGTGLGMSIVYNLVRLMRGDIKVESDVGVGTTVTLQIPQKVCGSERLGKETAENLRKLDASTLTKAKNLNFKPEPMPYGKVLVVDDVETNLYVAQGILGFYELNIETVGSGFDAVDKIKEGHVYDIIFMDHMMPGMDGVEATGVIRKLGYEEPIVALTANALIGQAEEFMRNGFDGFLSKPIETVHLNTILTKYVRDKQPEHVLEAAREAAKEISSADTESPAPADEQTIEEYLLSPELLAMVYQDFTESQANISAEIRAALDINDFKTAQHLAHTLKGLAGLMNEAVLTELSARAETAFRNSTVSEDTLLALEDEVERVLEIAKNHGA